MDPLDVFSLLLHPTNTTVPAVSPSDSFFVPFGAQATLLLLFYDYNPVTLESRYGSTVLALSHEHKLDDVLAALFNTVAAVAAKHVGLRAEDMPHATGVVAMIHLLPMLAAAIQTVSRTHPPRDAVWPLIVTACLTCMSCAYHPQLYTDCAGLLADAVRLIPGMRYVPGRLWRGVVLQNAASGSR